MIDIEHIEAVMKLMTKYKVDEFSSEHFTVKKSDFVIEARNRVRRTAAKLVAQHEADQAFLDKHVAPPQSDAPWDQIPEEALERYAINGRLGG